MIGRGQNQTISAGLLSTSLKPLCSSCTVAEPSLSLRWDVQCDWDVMTVKAGSEWSGVPGHSGQNLITSDKREEERFRGITGGAALMSVTVVIRSLCGVLKETDVTCLNETAPALKEQRCWDSGNSGLCRIFMLKALIL